MFKLEKKSNEEIKQILQDNAWGYKKCPCLRKGDGEPQLVQHRDIHLLVIKEVFEMSFFLFFSFNWEKVNDHTPLPSLTTTKVAVRPGVGPKNAVRPGVGR